MKQLSKFIQEKLHVSQYKKEKEGVSVIEDKNNYVMSLIEEDHLKNIFKILYDHKFKSGDITTKDYILVDITTHYKDYEYDKDEQKLIDYAVKNKASIYKAMEVLFDIGQNLGIVIVKEK